MCDYHQRELLMLICIKWNRIKKNFNDTWHYLAVIWEQVEMVVLRWLKSRSGGENESANWRGLVDKSLTMF